MLSERVKSLEDDYNRVVVERNELQEQAMRTRDGIAALREDLHRVISLVESAGKEKEKS